MLLEFQEAVFPSKVMMGYLSFNARAYVAPPLRCYNTRGIATLQVCVKESRDVDSVEESMLMENVGMIVQLNVAIMAEFTQQYMEDAL